MTWEFCVTGPDVQHNCSRSEADVVDVCSREYPGYQTAPSLTVLILFLDQRSSPTPSAALPSMKQSVWRSAWSQTHTNIHFSFLCSMSGEILSLHEGHDSIHLICVILVFYDTSGDQTNSCSQNSHLTPYFRLPWENIFFTGLHYARVGHF